MYIKYIISSPHEFQCRNIVSDVLLSLMCMSLVYTAVLQTVNPFVHIEVTNSNNVHVECLTISAILGCSLY